MRLLVLGASGACGAWLVRRAVERGHRVTALVRAPSRDEPPPGVNVICGDVAIPAEFDRTLPGHDAVLSALGLRRAGRSPWAALRSPHDLMTRVAALLASAMPRAGIGRLVAVSAAGVGDSMHQLTWPVRLLVRSGNIGVAYRDLAGMEAALGKSELDWLAVRPVTLLHGPPRKPARRVERYRLTSVVRRSEVAEWMLSAVEQPTPFRERTVMIGR